MENLFTKFKTEMVFRSIVMIIAGVVLVIFPSATQNSLAYAISVVLVICGLLRILRYCGVIGRSKSNTSEYGLNEYASPMDLITGVLMIVFAALMAKVLISFIPVVLGIIVLISGLVKLEQAIELCRSHRGNWIGILVMAIITIVVGLVSVFNPFATGNLLLRVIGIGLAFGGITDLISTGYMSKKFKSMQDDDLSDF
ncbi:MAG: HdeD family acid-resistance protein [Wujia sp.]